MDTASQDGKGLTVLKVPTLFNEHYPHVDHSSNRYLLANVMETNASDNNVVHS